MTDILIPFFNEPALLFRCLRALELSGPIPGRVVLIDDGSSSDSRRQVDAFCSQLNLPLVRVTHEENKGYRESIHTGLKFSDQPEVILLNSDAVVTPNFLRLLTEPMRRDARIKAVGPVSNHPTDLFQYRTELGEACEEATGETLMKTVARLAWRVQRGSLGKLTNAPYLTGMCLALERRSLDEAGLFSRGYHHGYFEDLDLSCRLRQAGFTLAVREDCFVYHEGAGTYRRMPTQALAEIREANFQVFCSAWGHLPEHAALVRLLRLRPSSAPSTGSVRFDLVARREFGRHSTSGNAPMPGRFASVTRYSRERSFAEVWKEKSRMLAGDFVLFADEGLATPNETLERLTAMADGDPLVQGFHFGCDPTLAGRANPPGSTIPFLPSWFCALRRSLLDEIAGDVLPYRTLDFFLFEVAARIAPNNPRIVGLDRGRLGFDWKRWAANQLLEAPSAWAEDFQVFRQRFGDLAADSLPPQFQVRTRSFHLQCSPSKPPSAGSEPEPLFTVICPAYKAEFFEEMLQSVLGQSWLDFEFVVLLDGPPPPVQEKLLSVLQRFSADRRLRFELQENRGTGPSRQRLVEMARGRYILSVDDDDMLPRGTLATFATAIRERPDLPIFRGGAQLIGLSARYLPPRPRFTIGGIVNDLFEATQPFVIRRDIIRSLGGFEGDPDFGGAGEDSDFFHKADRQGLETALLDEPLYLRRLSRVNQTLSIEASACIDHLRNLTGKHAPSGWRVGGFECKRHGAFIEQTANYQQPVTGLQVVTGTRFFEYRTQGEAEEVTIDFEVTSACNAACSFCPRDAMPDTARMTSMETVAALAAQLAASKSRRKVVLCGIGEPTLHPKLPDIVGTFAATGATIAMTTNGARMTADLFDRLAGRGLSELNFSLNAVTAATHEKVMRTRQFDRLEQTVHDVIKLRNRAWPNLAVRTSFVVVEENRHEAEEFARQWRSRGASMVWFHPLNNRAGLLNPGLRPISPAWLAEKFRGDPFVMVDVFSPVPDDGPVCKIARTMNFISSDGEMRLCAMDYERKTAFGNAASTSLDRMSAAKLAALVNGDTASLCQRCDFHPQKLSGHSCWSP